MALATRVCFIFATRVLACMHSEHYGLFQLHTAAAVLLHFYSNSQLLNWSWEVDALVTQLSSLPFTPFSLFARTKVLVLRRDAWNHSAHSKEKKWKPFACSLSAYRPSFFGYGDQCVRAFGGIMMPTFTKGTLMLESICVSVKPTAVLEQKWCVGR